METNNGRLSATGSTPKNRSGAWVFSKALKHTVPWLLIGILAVGAFFRFYNSYDGLLLINDSITDIGIMQGIAERLSSIDADALILKNPQIDKGVAEIYIPGSPPQALHHGVFYYYLLAVPAAIGGFHPYAPTVAIILLNVAAVYLMYLCGKTLLGEYGGLIAAFLFALSSFAISYGRWLWNPNLIVFFSLLTVVAFLKIAQGNAGYWPLFGFAAAATTQLHAVGYLFVFLLFVPLFLFVRVALPRELLLLFSIFCFLLPLVPEILSETSSHFSLATMVWGALPRIFASSSAGVSLFFDLSRGLAANTMITLFTGATYYTGLLWQYNTMVLGVPFFRVMLLLELFVAGGVVVETLISFLRARVRRGQPEADYKLSQMVRRARFLFPRILMVGVWIFVAVFIVVFVAQPHLARGIPHALLFVLPLFLILYAGMLKMAFSRAWLFPFGVVLLAGFLYANVYTIHALVWHPPKATLEEIESVASHLATRPYQDYELIVDDRDMEQPLLWALSRRGVLPPRRMATIDGRHLRGDTERALVRVQVVIAPYDQGGSSCGVSVDESFFGRLHLSSCFHPDSH